MNSQLSKTPLKIKKNYNYQKYFTKSIIAHICPDIDIKKELGLIIKKFKNEKNY